MEWSKLGVEWSFLAGERRADFDEYPKSENVRRIQSYASLIHKLRYRRRNHENIPVRGYEEEGSVNSHLSLPSLIKLIGSIWLSHGPRGCPFRRSFRRRR